MNTPAEYFWNVSADLHALSLVSRVRSANDTYDLVDMLDRASRAIGREPLPTVDHTDLRTDFGRTVLHAMQSGIQFSQSIRSYAQICCKAEPLTISSLATAVASARDNTVNPQASPAIITDGDKMIAVAKAEGERTILALDDSPDLGLVKNTYTSHRAFRFLHHLPPIIGAYAVDVSDLPSYYNFESPVRYSTFALAPGPRTGLTDTLDHWANNTAMLGTSTEDLAGQASMLLEHSPIRLYPNDHGRLEA